MALRCHRFHVGLLFLVGLSMSSPRILAQPAPQAKADVADRMVELAFGAGSDESRQPIRLWLADIGTTVVAKEAVIMLDSRVVRLTPASVAVFEAGQSKPLRVLRGESVLIGADQAVALLSDLRMRRINSVEIQDKNATITLTPREDADRVFLTLGSKIGSTRRQIPSEEIEILLTQEKKEDKGKDEKKDPEPRPLAFRFQLKIDPKTPIAELLPAPPKTAARLPLWTNEDLAKVPELMFGEPLSKDLGKHQAIETTSHTTARINHLNARKTDGFLHALLEQRTDLRGLPFLMGEECRTRQEEARVFHAVANVVNQAVQNPQFTLVPLNALNDVLQQAKANLGKVQHDQFDRATVGALTQILMPESEAHRVALARYLARIPHVEATHALARLAIFSPEEEVRAAAIAGLRVRREKDYTDILVQGFRYPLPAVAKRAAEAIVKLERNDLYANLIEVLERPDPRLPVTEKQGGKDVTFVRELVKVNHHRNCLLCHAPANTDNVPEGVLTVAVPLPNEPLAKPAQGGYQSTPPPSPDIVVRLDMTYLRQDFSLMMPVSDPHPWPELQRFDFLVRTRTLTASEAQAYEPCCEMDEPGRLSPYHRAALYALRELTGRDTEPTAAAWRKLLKLPAR